MIVGTTLKQKIILSFVLSFIFFISAPAALLEDKESIESQAPLSLKSRYEVMTIFKAVPGQEEALKLAVLAVVEASRKEPTNFGCTVSQRSEWDGVEFVLVGIWTGKEDYSSQFTKPYMREFMEKTKTLLESPYQGGCFLS